MFNIHTNFVTYILDDFSSGLNIMSKICAKNEQKPCSTCPKKTHFSIKYLCETHVSGFRYLFCHYPLWNMTKQKLTNSKKKYCLFRTLIIINDISIHHSFFKAICIHKYSCPLKKSYFRNKDK